MKIYKDLNYNINFYQCQEIKIEILKNLIYNIYIK